MDSKKLTRREFLKSAAIGAAGIAALGIFGPGLLSTAHAEAGYAAQADMALHSFDFTRRVVRLNNGTEMPIIGLGTFNLTEEEAENSVYWALKAGHRLIDTAQAYANETGVGRGIKRAIEEGIVQREDIFVTTKLWPISGYNAEAIDTALEKLQLDYIDLLLLHQPMSDYVGGYKIMEDAVAQGKVRSIGVSNFSVEQFEEIIAAASIVPAVHQVETHLYNQQDAMLEYLRHYEAVLEGWFPLGGRTNVATFLAIPEVQQLAAVYGKTPAQIIIRWHLQSGHVCFPGSTNEAHIRENIDVFDFELTAAEMALLDSLNRNAPYYKRMGSTEEEIREMMQSWSDDWNLDVGF